MKKKYLKIATILITGLIAMHVGSNEVKAVYPYSCIKFQRGDNLRLSGTGTLPGTWDMYVSFGNEYDSNKNCIVGNNQVRALCAFYWYEPPTTGSYIFDPQNSFKLKYNQVEINDLAAMGVAKLAQDTSVKNKYSLSDNDEVVVKVTALNLYLSKITGVNRFETPSGAEKQWNYIGVIGNNLNNIDKMIKGFEESNNDYDKAVWELYNLATTIASSSTGSLSLNFTDNTKTFTLKDGFYSATFNVESNVDISSVNAVVSGISGNATITQSTFGKTGTITVSFPRSAVPDNTTKVTVTATAMATQKKTTMIVTSTEGINSQPFVIIPGAEGRGEFLYEPVYISTEKTVGLEVLCYRYKATCGDTACSNTRDNNVRECSTFTESYTADSCESTDNGIKEFGKKEFDLIPGVCSLYCTEKADASYPGNVSPAVTMNTNLIWPTIGDPYPLTTHSVLKCQVMMHNDSPVSQACLDVANQTNYTYINGSGAQLYYNDTTGDKEPIPLNQSCNSSFIVIGSSVTITNNCQYTLPENQYVAISKDKAKFIADFATAYTDHILITEYGGVLPIGGISWKESKLITKELFGNNYKLQIKDLPLGYGNQLAEKLNETDYICKYNVTTEASGECKCPPGTKHVGMDLTGILEKIPNTCAEAKEVYCDSDICYTNPELCVCPPNTKHAGESIEDCLKDYDYEYCVKNHPCDEDNIRYCTRVDGTLVDITDCWFANGQNQAADKFCTNLYCPLESDEDSYCPADSVKGNTYKYKDDPRYTACLGAGGEQKQCMAYVCNIEECGDDPNCKYKCPDNSDYPKKDISICISEQRANPNNSLQNALDFCYKRCYKTAGSEIIIYRTISLENPFPSMNGDKSTNQTGLSEGMFNDTVKGRYPGTNWNGISVVKNNILNNRGYDGSAIYQEATPLYTFNLDATAIKKIRDYNTKQAKESAGYADWDLTCTNGAYCISEFVHKSGITTATGNSILDSSNSTCANASNKSSFISCYNQP